MSRQVVRCTRLLSRTDIRVCLTLQTNFLCTTPIYTKRGASRGPASSVPEFTDSGHYRETVPWLIKELFKNGVVVKTGRDPNSSPSIYLLGAILEHHLDIRILFSFRQPLTKVADLSRRSLRKFYSVSAKRSGPIFITEQAIDKHWLILREELPEDSYERAAAVPVLGFSVVPYGFLDTASLFQIKERQQRSQQRIESYCAGWWREMLTLQP